MAKGQKISRKELLKEPDQFLSISDRVLIFFSENKSQIIGVVLGVVIITAGFFGYRYNRQVNALRMETLYFEMNQTIEKNKDKQPEFLTAELAKLLDQFSDGPAKQRATLLLAESYFQNEQYDRAISRFSEVLEKGKTKQLPYSLAQVGIAYSHEGKKEYKKAIQTYKSVIDSNGVLPRFHVYFSLARCYELDNDFNNALLILREMQNKFPGHARMNLVERKIQKFSAQS